MIKRPLSPQFADLVTSGRKTTTIRKAAWPVHKPIMLYRWAGKAYRSKQVNVAIVEVVRVLPIKITHRAAGLMVFDCPYSLRRPLWVTEGFDSPESMDAWFRERIAPGEIVEMFLMGFGPIDAPREISKLLEELSDSMEEVAEYMEYYGGFNAEMVQHAKELRGAADLVSAWGREIEGGKLL